MYLSDLTHKYNCLTKTLIKKDKAYKTIVHNPVSIFLQLRFLPSSLVPSSLRSASFPAHCEKADDSKQSGQHHPRTSCKHVSGATASLPRTGPRHPPREEPAAPDKPGGEEAKRNHASTAALRSWETLGLGEETHCREIKPAG